MEALWEAIITAVIGVVGVAATIFLRWLTVWLNERGLSKDRVDAFNLAIEAWGSRVRDKFLVELMAMKDPDSPGGEDITAEELSALREKAYDLFLNDATEPVVEQAMELGKDAVKGLLGRYISPLFNYGKAIGEGN